MNKLKTGILAGTMAFSLGACERGPLHQIDKNTNKIVERIDSFAKSKFNKQDTIGLTLFRTDTLEIRNKSLDNPQRLKDRLQKIGKRRIPYKTVGSEVTFGPTVGPHINTSGDFKFGPGIGLHTEDVEKPLYLRESVKTVLQNKVYSTPDNKEFYVPVSYYGKMNPIFIPKDTIK